MGGGGDPHRARAHRLDQRLQRGGVGGQRRRGVLEVADAFGGAGAQGAQAFGIRLGLAEGDVESYNFV